MLRDAEGRVAGVELVEHAAEGVHVDGARVAQGVDAGDVAGEHLGRRVVRRGVAPDVGEHREGAVGGGDAHGAAHVDQADVERPVRELPLDRRAGGPEHDVSGGDVPVDEAPLERPRAVEDREDGEAEPSGQTPRPGDPSASRERVVQRGALDPLHDDRGAPLHRAVAVDLRKAAEAGDGELIEVLLVEGALPGEGQGVSGGGDARRAHDLERKGLPVGVGGLEDLARGALARAVPRDDEAGVAPERLLGGHRRRSRHEVLDLNDSALRRSVVHPASPRLAYV